MQQRVHRELDRFGLAGHADHPAHLLSGGQKQLLALTSVLVTEPDVLVCDEPTTLLDVRNAGRVLELLAELPQQVVLRHPPPGPAGRVRPGAGAVDEGRVRRRRRAGRGTARPTAGLLDG